jgi:hypothetical protein
VTEFSPPRRRTQNTATNGSLVYHTRKCQAYVRIVNWVECTENEKAVMEECRYCSDSNQLNDGGDMKYYQAAVAHGTEEGGD